MIGVMSDIHGNLEALRAVLARGAELGADDWVCLGDVVGYGADPNECVDLVSRLCGVVLLGNHDEAAISDDDLSWFNPWAAEAVLWTRRTLEVRWRQYLAERPLRHEDPIATYVHGSPVRPEAWHYVLTRRDAERESTGFSTPLCFVGHSHQPDAYELPPASESSTPRYLINVGSVGQPRDGDPRACFVTLDVRTDGTTQVKFERVAYDIPAAQRKIRAAGLRETLATRLEMGV